MGCSCPIEDSGEECTDPDCECDEDYCHDKKKTYIKFLSCEACNQRTPTQDGYCFWCGARQEEDE